jgi:dsDNA-binding SOS-regulon protein
MAVVAMWKCDRDNSMFESKKNADAHDKMLELAESFSALLSRELASISEQEAENIGLLLSKNKELLVNACKGKPDLLLDIGIDHPQDDSNVTPLAAKGTTG